MFYYLDYNAIIERFYDVDQGEILIDGVNTKNLDPTWLRSQIAVVSQEPFLFSTTIEENIKYADPNATQEQLYAVASLANCHQFISNFPLGYQTMVGERGMQLSGGQKQRIAIARALLVNPRILILDEATSALDTESEGLVQEALENLMKGRTVIIIAHRLSTVQRANRIVVMKHGKTIEEGTHQQLLSLPGGVYASLVARQLQKKDQPRS